MVERARLIPPNSDSFTPCSDAGTPSMVTRVETEFAAMVREAGQDCGVVVLDRTVCGLDGRSAHIRGNPLPPRALRQDQGRGDNASGLSSRRRITGRQQTS
ncbi:hypothetical protein [Saccharopolyspora sp. CA-218241]|uniref:hypothetical protein n=1 Tax=Saccharopolyspora sp. CA-218241 TaxID=3240027 RepID=UPI003D975CCE